MKRIDPIGFGSQDTTLEMLDTDNVLAVFQETYPDFHELLTSVLQDMAREVRFVYSPREIGGWFQLLVCNRRYRNTIGAVV